jgi:thioredoxin-dependent peroxiredoxin
MHVAKVVGKGDKAPEFVLPDASGKKIALKDFRGKSNVVLYFYPKDDTPGCTAEACSFRDHMEMLENTASVILGVSPDSQESHEKFSRKYGLPFPLLADTDKKVSKAYGVWKKKTLYGRNYMGIERSTFIIDKSGRILDAFRKVKVDGHTGAVVAALEIK